MDDAEWKSFFLICADQLGAGEQFAAASASWCAFTTFGRLNEDVGYWTMGLAISASSEPRNLAQDQVMFCRWQVVRVWHGSFL